MFKLFGDFTGDSSNIVTHSGIVILIITKFNLITVAINYRSKRN